MRTIIMAMVVAASVLAACGGGGGQPPTGSGGSMGGSGGEGPASSSSSSSSGSTSTPLALKPDCDPDTSIGPIVPGDNLVSPDGAVYDERGGTWALRCYPNPDPVGGYTVDTVDYSIAFGPGSPRCRKLAHAVGVFGLHAFPQKGVTTPATPVVKFDQAEGLAGNLSADFIKSPVIHDPIVCGGVQLRADSDTVKLCLGACKATIRTPDDHDAWGADDPMTGLPIDGQIVQLVESPTVKLGGGFGPFQLGIGVTGHID